MYFKQYITDENYETLDEYNYFVSYDSDRLKELLEQLKEFTYTCSESFEMSNNRKRFLSKKKPIEQVVIDFFQNDFMHKQDRIHPETIKYRKDENGVMFLIEYEYDKVVDLYHYVAIILNQEKLEHFFGLIRPQEEREKDLLNHLFQYDKTVEFDEGLCTMPYDYSELHRLYKEVLKCFRFKLISVTKHERGNKESTDGIAFQKKWFIPNKDN